MKDYDYHSLFYYQALSTIQGLRGPGGSGLRAPKVLDTEVEFTIGYEPVEQGFPHNYMAEEFGLSRPKYLVAHKSGSHPTVIMKFSRTSDDAVLYKKGLRVIFNKDYPVARRELETLMSKFYKLTHEQYFEKSQVDMGTNPRSPRHMRVDDLIRKNR